MANDFEQIRKDRALCSVPGVQKVTLVVEMGRRHPEMSLQERIDYVEYLQDNLDTPLEMLDGHTAFMRRR